MPGLDPGIHVLVSMLAKKDVDGRAKPGHDDEAENDAQRRRSNHACRAPSHALPCD